MTSTPNRLLMASALLAAVTLAGCQREDAAPTPTPPPAVEPAPAPPPPPAPVAATASVTGLTLGNAVGADMAIAAPATTFAPTDTIHAAVATSTSDPMATVNGTLAAKWTFEDGQTVNEESRDVVLTGNGTTVFQISKPDGWPVGKYKVEISMDGTPVQSADFEVK
ncbi:MAG: hypothetical protein ACRC2H_12610 [Silanimonas sp.]